MNPTPTAIRSVSLLMKVNDNNRAPKQLSQCQFGYNRPTGTALSEANQMKGDRRMSLTYRGHSQNVHLDAGSVGEKAAISNVFRT